MQAFLGKHVFLPFPQMPAEPLENNIPFPILANHIVPSKFWKVDLDRRVTPIITRSAWNNQGKLNDLLIHVRLRTAKVTFSQILEYMIVLSVLYNLSEGKKRRKKVNLGSHFYTITSVWLLFSLSTLYFKTVPWSHTMWIKQWERNVVPGWAGACREGQNTSCPNSNCVEGDHPWGCSVVCSSHLSPNRVFSHDITAAILVSQNNETAAMLVSQTSPLGVELVSYANAFFCSNKFVYMLAKWVKTLYSL